MAAQIIRRTDRAEGGITEAERAAMTKCAKEWIANAMRTDRADPQEVGDAIRALYAAADLPAPRVVLVPSPRIMAFAGGFASAAWWRRDNPDAVRTDAATRAATDDATDAATDAATRDATRAATDAATYDATRDATRAATDDATYDATRDATGVGGLFALAADILGADAELGIACARAWYRPYQGGNMWAAWDCFLAAARDVLGLRLPQHAKYAAWERAAKCGGFRWMHPEFCLVSDFPEVLKVDAQNRPHCADGPSHRWRDGWALYHIHGVRVESWIVEHPERVTVSTIEAEANAEVRRVMIERYGWSRYIADCGAEIVDTVLEDHPIAGLRGTKLLRKVLPDEPEPIVYLSMLNSTPEPDGSVKIYLERIDPKAYGGDAARNCHAAMASRWRYRDERGDLQLTFRDWRAYRPAQES